VERQLQKLTPNKESKAKKNMPGACVDSMNLFRLRPNTRLTRSAGGDGAVLWGERGRAYQTEGKRSMRRNMRRATGDPECP